MKKFFLWFIIPFLLFLSTQQHIYGMQFKPRLTVRCFGLDPKNYYESNIYRFLKNQYFLVVVQNKTNKCDQYYYICNNEGKILFKRKNPFFNENKQQMIPGFFFSTINTLKLYDGRYVCIIFFSANEDDDAIEEVLYVVLLDEKQSENDLLVSYDTHVLPSTIFKRIRDYFDTKNHNDAISEKIDFIKIGTAGSVLSRFLCV